MKFVFSCRRTQFVNGSKNTIKLLKSNRSEKSLVILPIEAMFDDGAIPYAS